MPQLGKAILSEEVCLSLDLAPQSHVVKKNLPWVITFDTFFRLSPSCRAERRAKLNALASNVNNGKCASNYEAHQAPLAYLALSPIDRLLSGVGLPRRILCLRLLSGILGCTGTIWAMRRLARTLGLSAMAYQTAVFLVLTSQMFYATVAHVANDWLAVPLAVVVCERLLSLWRQPSRDTLLSLFAALTAGLLTKSYFLAFCPPVICISALLLYRRRISTRTAVAAFGCLAFAAPWYLRNWLLYGTISGMQEAIGIGNFVSVIVSISELPWWRAALELSYGVLWTGNNSVNTFSHATLTQLLIGYAVALGLASIRLLRKPTAEEQLLLVICVIYTVALGYSSLLTFVYTQGKGFSPSPWYAEPLRPLIVTFLCAGSGYHIAVRAVRTWLIAWSSYLLLATYWVKLIPQYSGFPDGKVTLSRLFTWYADWEANAALLSATAMVSAEWIVSLAVAVSGFVLVLASSLTWLWMNGSASVKLGDVTDPRTGL